MVLVAGLFFFGIKAIQTIKIDIFPAMNMPVIYLSHPFGGYSPTQMESFFGKQYVNILLYVSGVKSIETKNIQGLSLLKLTFYENVNMAQAAAEVSAFANRAQAIFPPGSQPPFVIRFDASTLPVGQLVLSSEKRSNNELLDMANVYIRSSFTSIPGLISAQLSTMSVSETIAACGMPTCIAIISSLSFAHFYHAMSRMSFFASIAFFFLTNPPFSPPWMVIL